MTCLGCNGAAAAHDRRLLSGSASSEVHSAWKDILAMKVQDNESLVNIVAQMEASASSGYLCRKCLPYLSDIKKQRSYS